MAEKIRDVHNLEDLNNEEMVSQLLEEGAPDGLKRVQAFYDLTNEDVTRYSNFAKLRKQTLDDMKDELAIRVSKNSVPTQEEFDAGAYREMIEPQVRDAVFDLRRKGYNTYESGFAGLDGSQRIGVEEGQFKDIKFPDTLYEEMASQGIDIVVDKGSLMMRFSSFKNLDEIQTAWSKIAQELPDRGVSVGMSHTRSAGYFREKHPVDPS